MACSASRLRELPRIGAYARPAATVMPQKCGSCHSRRSEGFSSSAHGSRAQRGPGRPDLRNVPWCHPQDSGRRGSAVARGEEKSAADLAAPATPIRLSRAITRFLSRIRWKAIQASVHGRAVAAGNQQRRRRARIAIRRHAIYPAQDARSKINHWNVPAHLCRLPRGNRENLSRERSRASRRAWRVRRAGLHGLPRRSRYPRAPAIPVRW